MNESWWWVRDQQFRRRLVGEFYGMLVYLSILMLLIENFSGCCKA